MPPRVLDTLAAILFVTALSSTGQAYEITYGLAVDMSCPVCLEWRPIKFEASSTLADKKNRYAAPRAFDNDAKTAWCEGAKGDGKGESLTVHFSEARSIHAMEVLLGYFKSKKTFFANGAVAELLVTNDQGKKSTWKVKPVADDAEEYERSVSLRALSPVLDWPSRWLKFEIKDARPGKKYHDTCISEISIYAVDPAEVD